MTALQIGVDSSAPLAPALGQLYRAARAALLDCAPHFDARAVLAIRNDFADVGRSLIAA